MKLFPLLTFTALASVATAFPSAPGACLTGSSSPNGPHVGGGQGSIEDGEVTLTINGAQVSDGMTLIVGTTYDVVLSRPGGFSGFLLVFDGGDSDTFSEDFTSSTSEDLVGAPSPACPEDLGSVSHINNDERVVLGDITGTMTVDTPGTFRLDVNVVVAVPNWFYSGFSIEVLESASACPEGEFAFVPGVCVCFSGDSLVETSTQGVIAMKNLEIGDQVRVADNKFEPVYSFGHYSQGGSHIYLIFNDELEISPAHMLAVDGRGFVPASTVNRGDYLVNGSGSATTEVKSITTKKSAGMFAPFTPSGTIVVNGIVASSFISMQGDSAKLVIGGVNTGLTWHFLAHTFEFPHRLVCHYFGRCMEETYTPAHGMSTWVAKPHALAIWLNEHSFAVNVAFWTPILVVAGLFASLETIMTVPIFALILVGAALMYSRTSMVKSKVL